MKVLLNLSYFSAKLSELALHYRFEQQIVLRS